MAAVIVAIPVAFLYNIFLDKCIAGSTLGVVKRLMESMPSKVSGARTSANGCPH